MKNIFENAASIFALIPGLAAMLEQAPVPPDAKWFFCMLAEVLGICAILVMGRLQKSIRNSTARCIDLLPILLVLVGIILAIGDFLLYQRSTVTPTGDFRGKSKVFFPLWLNHDVAQLADKVDGNRAKLVEEFGPDDINDRLANQGLTPAKLVTFAVFLALYEGVFVCWTIAFCILSFRSPPQ